MNTTEKICRLFGIQGEMVKEDQMKAGNINATYKMTFKTTEGEPEDFILQRINGYVFKNPKQIMSNIALVTEHIREKLEKEGKDASRLVLQFLKQENGDNYYQDEDGHVWRVYRFVPNSVAVNATGDLTILRNAGRAFGTFQKDLLDFDAEKLYETIPDFHNTVKRLDTLFASVERDECGRVKEAQDLIDYMAASREKAGSLIRMTQEGTLPLRVTHNDTKSNNVLFDADTGEELAVIDLDTIMPGLMAYDFGDAVRFAANTAAEDEPDLSRVSLDLERFAAFAEGFAGALADTITEAEKNSLALGAYAITIELASRFLDDYLTGDKYFGTAYPGHNLVRAACQIELAKDMERKMTEMEKIISEIC